LADFFFLREEGAVSSSFESEASDATAKWAPRRLVLLALRRARGPMGRRSVRSFGHCLYGGMSQVIKGVETDDWQPGHLGSCLFLCQSRRQCVWPRYSQLGTVHL
jgi:hypothetical protein